MPTNYTKNKNHMVLGIGKFPGEPGVILQNKNPKWEGLYNDLSVEKWQEINLKDKNDHKVVAAQELGKVDLVIGRTLRNRKYKIYFIVDTQWFSADLPEGIEGENFVVLNGEIGWWAVSKSWMLIEHSDALAAKGFLEVVDKKTDISEDLADMLNKGLVRFLVCPQSIKNVDAEMLFRKYVIAPLACKFITTTMADVRGKIFHWWGRFMNRYRQFVIAPSDRIHKKYGDTMSFGKPESGPRLVNSNCIRYDWFDSDILMFSYIKDYDFHYDAFGILGLDMCQYSNKSAFYKGSRRDFEALIKRRYAEYLGLSSSFSFAAFSNAGPTMMSKHASVFLNNLMIGVRKPKVYCYKYDTYEDYYNVNQTDKKLMGCLILSGVALFPCSTDLLKMKEGGGP